MIKRKEYDSMGEVSIPRNFLYGASTQRAVDVFQVSSRLFGRNFIEALALVKWAAASANKNLKMLDPKLANLITSKSLEIARGDYDQHFIVDIFQTGSGTSTNMNINEIIANIANRELGSELGSKMPIHPNDHVNCGQSSNDVIPTAIHVGAALAIHRHLLPSLNFLEKSLEHKEREFESIIKIGRTHLQDATPLTLGRQFFSKFPFHLILSRKLGFAPTILLKRLFKYRLLYKVQ